MSDQQPPFVHTLLAWKLRERLDAALSLISRLSKDESEAEAVELVFVLLTPDDEVAKHGEADPEKRRARQNVILELGFFLGKLGRKSGKILLLHKGPVEIPSDILGIEYIDITNGIESASETIRREMEALGILK